MTLNDQIATIAQSMLTATGMAHWRLEIVTRAFEDSEPVRIYIEPIEFSARIEIHPEWAQRTTCRLSALIAHELGHIPGYGERVLAGAASGIAARAWDEFDEALADAFGRFFLAAYASHSQND